MEKKYLIIIGSSVFFILLGVIIFVFFLRSIDSQQAQTPAPAITETQKEAPAEPQMPKEAVRPIPPGNSNTNITATITELTPTSITLKNDEGEKTLDLPPRTRVLVKEKDGQVTIADTSRIKAGDKVSVDVLVKMNAVNYIVYSQE